LTSLDRETTKLRLRANGTLLMQSVESQREIAQRMLTQADWDEAAALAMFDQAEELDDIEAVEKFSNGPVRRVWRRHGAHAEVEGGMTEPQIIFEVVGVEIFEGDEGVITLKPLRCMGQSQGIPCEEIRLYSYVGRRKDWTKGQRLRLVDLPEGQ
jgi:hypothetical protein